MTKTDLAVLLCRFIGLYFLINAIYGLGSSVIMLGMPLLFGGGEQIHDTACAQHGDPTTFWTSHRTCRLAEGTRYREEDGHLSDIRVAALFEGHRSCPSP